MSTIRTRRCQYFSPLVVVATFAIMNRPVLAYTPDDPIVTNMVDRGVNYLESLEDNDFAGMDAMSNSGGEAILVAYAHHKCVGDPESRVVKRGLQVAKRFVDGAEAGRADNVACEAQAPSATRRLGDRPHHE